MKKLGGPTPRPSGPLKVIPAAHADTENESWEEF
jgi:hypothetical protein